MSRQVWVSLVLVAVLLIGGGGTAVWLIDNAPQAGSTVPARPPLVVSAVRAEPRTIVEPILGYGSAQADQFARIASQVAGEVVEVPPVVKVGAPVETGQLLVRIDDREYREQLARAQSMLAADKAALEQLDVEQDNLRQMLDLARSELAIAEREHERVRGLLEQQVSTPREYDEALNALKLARRTAQTYQNQLALIPDQRRSRAAAVAMREAEVGMARLNVERCTIAAPFQGRLDAVDVEIGERVAPGSPLVSLLDPTLIDIPIELPISQRPSLQAGAACELTLESRDDFAWKGRVARIAPAASMTLRTFEVFVEVDNREQPLELMPGMFVRARIEGRTLEDVIAIPRGSIQNDRVYLFQDGKAQPRFVEIERRLIDQAVVRGLEPGDLVITSNLDALDEGAPVVLREQVVAEADRPRPAAGSRAAAAGIGAETTP